MIIPEKVKKLGIKNYVNTKGDVCCARMFATSEQAAACKEERFPPIVAKCDYKHEPEYRYFLDNDGDISRVTEEEFKKQERGEDFISQQPYTRTNIKGVRGNLV